MVSKPEVVVDGIAMPEGPVWCDDGTLVCTSVTDAKLWRIWPEQGRKEDAVRHGGRCQQCGAREPTAAS